MIPFFPKQCRLPAAILAGVALLATQCKQADPETEAETDVTTKEPPEAPASSSATSDSPAENLATPKTGAEFAQDIQVDPSLSGEALFATICANCHGAAGEGKQDQMAPSIAGQPDWFIAFQLQKFRDGHRGAKEQTDPNAALMRTVSLALTEETIPKIAAAVQAMKPVPTTVEVEGDGQRGETLFMNICAQCHRFNGQGEKAFHSAPLTALPEWYIRESLRKFRERKRGYSHGDMEGPKMQGIADLLGEEEISDLVTHIATLAERYPPGEERRR